MVELLYKQNSIKLFIKTDGGVIINKTVFNDLSRQMVEFFINKTVFNDLSRHLVEFL